MAARTSSSSRFRGLALAFDDVLLEPQTSSVLPRTTNISIKLTRSITLDIPIVSAAMDTVTESTMAITLGKLGGLGVIHRNNTIQKQAEGVRAVKDVDRSLHVAAAIGVGEEMMPRASALVDAGVDVLVVDTAHGHHMNVVHAVPKLKKAFPKTPLIVGNIATKEGAQLLIKAGADALKVGIGCGSICTTRDVAGVGVPQFTAILECAEVARKYHVPVIADGGIVYPADIAKALAAGASAVMLGNMLAGTDEAPGDVFTSNNGQRYKTYRGMGSKEAQQKRGTDRYFSRHVPEGVSGKVPYKGPVATIIEHLVGALRTAMGYYGAATIADLWTVTYWQITGAGLKESHPHHIIMHNAPEFLR
ncbi:MAG: IMP dehydrogenase [bacterium]|nr:IMP dehydrogenase [bacterium]